MRPWIISKALKSSRSLSEVIGEMTEEEIMNVLETEFESTRRRVIIDKLIQKAAEIHRRNYLKSLKEKYRGSY
jgi:hypothetical protein